MKYIIFFPIFISIFILSYSQTETSYWHKNELYFSFNAQKETVKQLAKFLSIDDVKAINQSKKYTVTAYANPKTFAKFKTYNISYQAHTHPGIMPIEPKMHNIHNKDNYNYTTYPTYDIYINLMNEFATQYPDICKLVDLGESVDGRKILFLKISDNINTNEAEPRVMYSSTMHGDETPPYVLMLRFIDYLLSNYNQKPKITQLINNLEIWINPLANPDGTYANGNNTVSGARRFNFNGVDLNRNFPDFTAGTNPDGNNWQPENIIIMHLTDSLHFVLSANMHTGAEVINYPWDTQSILPADNNWWCMASKTYADTTIAYSHSGYLQGVRTSGYVNGYEWYTMNGSKQDFMNYYRSCREVTFELCNNKNPSDTILEYLWHYNYRSFITYLEQANYGIHGIVTDSLTGNPLKAKIYINAYDFDSSHIYSELPYGDYYRPIYMGNYTATFSCPGYYSKSISNIQVDSAQKTTLNVQLVPIHTESIIKDAQQPQLYIHPNPIINNIITINNPKNLTIKKIEVLSTGGKLLKSKIINNNNSQVSISYNNTNKLFYVTVFYANNQTITKLLMK